MTAGLFSSRGWAFIEIWAFIRINIYGNAPWHAVLMCHKSVSRGPHFFQTCTYYFLLSLQHLAYTNCRLYAHGVLFFFKSVMLKNERLYTFPNFFISIMLKYTPGHGMLHMLSKCSLSKIKFILGGLNFFLRCPSLILNIFAVVDL